jgi:hypothetical protein
MPVTLGWSACSKQTVGQSEQTIKIKGFMHEQSGEEKRDL